MNPILHGVGIALLVCALAASLGAIAATIWPARRKIVSALRGTTHSNQEHEHGNRA